MKTILLMSCSILCFIGFCAKGVCADDSARILQIRPGGYECGALPSAPDANWCKCYENFLNGECKSGGGADADCNVATLRFVVEQYGGPRVLCSLLPSLSVSPTQCFSTMSYYLKAC